MSIVTENNDHIPNKKIKKVETPNLDIDKICDVMMSRLQPHFKSFGDQIKQDIQVLRGEIEQMKKNPIAGQPQQVDMKGLMDMAGKALGVDLSGLQGMMPQGQAGGIGQPNVGQPVQNGGGLIGNLGSLVELLKAFGVMPQQQQNPMMAAMMEMMYRNQLASTMRSMQFGDAILQKFMNDPSKLAKFMEVEQLLVKEPIEMIANNLSGKNGSGQSPTVKSS